jgi:hypothetical protein
MIRLWLLSLMHIDRIATVLPECSDQWLVAVARMIAVVLVVSAGTVGLIGVNTRRTLVAKLNTAMQRGSRNVRQRQFWLGSRTNALSTVFPPPM